MTSKVDNGFNIFLLKLQSIVKTKIGLSRTAPSSPVSKKKFSETSNQNPIILINNETPMKKSKTIEELKSKGSSSSERHKMSKSSKKSAKLMKKGQSNGSDPMLRDSSVDLNASPAPVNNKASVKFQKIFSIDCTERLIKSFSCALVDEILFQGTFYVSRNYFCFYTKIANRRKMIKVAVENVDNITREKTAGIIPNAIAIHTKTERFLFTSFMLRDSTFRFISEIWDNRKSECNTLSWNEIDIVDVVLPDDVEDEVVPCSDDEFILAIDHMRPVPLNVEINDVTTENSSIRSNSNASFLPCDPLTASIVSGSHPIISTPAATSTHLGSTLPNVISSVKKLDNENAPPSWTLNQTKTIPNRGHVIKQKPSKCASRLSLESHSSFGDLARNEFLLLTAYFILIILTASAVFMAYRVHCFQQVLFDRVKSLSPNIAPSISDNFDTDSLMSKLQAT